MHTWRIRAGKLLGTFEILEFVMPSCHNNKDQLLSGRLILCFCVFKMTVKIKIEQSIYCIYYVL